MSPVCFCLQRRIVTFKALFNYTMSQFYFLLRKLPFLLLIFIFAGGCTENSAVIEANHPGITYTGRIDFSNPAQPVFFWPGSEATVRISGTGVKAEMNDASGENYFNIVVDEEVTGYIRLDTVKKWYTLADDLKEGVHTIRLVKRNEWYDGGATLHGFEVTGEVLPPAPKNNRTIEFIGNSITAGYAIEDLTGGDSPDSIYTNNYPTYGALAARFFEADYICTCRSGIGISVSWDPTIIMPEVFPRLDPTDPASKWDFAIQPDLVVVNLLQNDSWLVNLPEEAGFKARFGDVAPGKDETVAAYQEFISLVRTTYPGVPMICALGSMDATKEGSPWPGYVQEAVDGLGDSLIYTHFFPYIEKGGHPRVADNARMAESLITFIKEKLSW